MKRHIDSHSSSRVWINPSFIPSFSHGGCVDSEPGRGIFRHSSACCPSHFHSFFGSENPTQSRALFNKMKQGRWYCTGHRHPEGTGEYATMWQDETEVYLVINLYKGFSFLRVLRDSL